MATESFTKELTFNTKSAQKFLDALNRSKPVTVERKHQIKIINDKNSIKSIFNSVDKRPNC